MPRSSARALLDTGPVVALVNRADRYHERAAEWFRDYRGVLLTTEAVVTETAYVLASSLPHQQAALTWFARGAKAGLLRIEPMSDLEAVSSLMAKYASLPPDLADASLVWIAVRDRLDAVVSVDQADFSTYRSYGGRHFRNLFLKERLR